MGGFTQPELIMNQSFPNEIPWAIYVFECMDFCETAPEI